MSLTEQQIQQIQGEDGTEYTLIAAPLSNGVDSEVNYQVIQTVSSDQQENIDPQTQVLMLQPSFTVASDQFGHNQNAQYEQVQILPDNIQGHQVAVPLSEGHIVDGQYQQVLLTTGPDGQQHQIIIHQEVAPQPQNETPIPQAVPEQPKSQAIQPPVGKGPFRCDTCDKVFPKWNQLQRHLRSHEDDKPHRCPHCPATFNVEDNLRLHKATHSNTPICPECGKKFSRIASLKAHIMLHEKEENLMCTECGDEFSLQAQLDRHMTEHREEHEGSRVYHCSQCSLEFSKHSIYRDHMKQHNKVKSSLSHRTYKRNIDRSGFNHKCNHCGKTFQKPSQLLRHGRIHTGERPYKCDICDKAFNQKGALQIHMSKHTGQRPHICEFCPMTFSQKGNLRAHIRRVHSTPKDADTPVFNCEECSCVFRKLGSLNAHMSRMHSDSAPGLQEISVQYLDQSGVNKSEIIVANNLQGALEEVQQRVAQAEGKHSNVNPIVIQQLLELDGPDAENVQQQINQIAVGSNIPSDILQQALENSGLSIVPQPSSGQTEGTSTANGTSADGQAAGDGAVVVTAAATTPTPTSIVVTKEGHSTLRTLNILDAATGTVKKHVIRKVNGVRWHQCTYCAKEFKKPSDLVRHIRIHTHEKPYKCNQCFRAFAVNSTLTAHIKTHNGLKEHKCHLCDKLFSTVGSLRVHTRLHTGVKPFTCPHCDRKFRTSGHCKSHIASHFKEASPKKKRRLFRKSLKSDVSLPDIPLQEPILITDTGLIQQAPRHSQFYNQYLGEAGSVDRPYKCGYCSRGFKKSSHLKQHIRSHTGEKPYKCLQCMRAFISSGVLKAHVRTHTGEKCYKCVICDATFTTNGSLKRHMSTHSEVRPFMCPYCQKTFKTSVNCKKHMKTHRHELALQALRTDGSVKDAELVNTDHEVPEPGGEEEHEPSTPAPVDPPAFTPQDASLQQVELATLQQQTLTHDQQLQSLSQTEYPQQGTLVQQDLTQPTVIQDALVSDAQLQSTLNQQVLGSQQVTLPAPQQAFTQSLLNTSTSQQTFNQLNFSQPQFTLQSGQSIDVSSLTAYSQATPAITNALTSTNMSNILQPREPEIAADNQPEESMQDELDDLKRNYKCAFCSKGFKKSSHLKQHVRSHTGEKPFVCKVCNRTFVSHGVLKAHMKTHSGTKDFVCVVCSASFTTNGSLTRHMMLHSTAKRFKCPLCEETFRTAFLCKRHMRSHRDKNEDENEDGENDRPRRSRSVIQITEEEAQELSKTQPNEALSVSEKLLIESAAEKDRVSEMKMEKEIVTVVVDEEEDDVVDDEEETETSADPGDPSYTPTTGRQGHSCCYCPKSFRKPSDLVRHTRIHTGEKPFDCHLCGRSFTVKSTLDSHLRTHTSTEKKFRCHVCQSCFSTKGSLKVHMRLHTGAKPFKCPHCEQRFRTSGHRKSHIATHFKPTTPKKQRKYTQRTPRNQLQHQQQDQPQQVDFLNVDASMLQGVTQAGTNQVQVGNQIINIDQSLIQGQNLLPVSLNLESLGLTESGLAAQVLQGGLDGFQFQVAGNVGQNIQIQGLDPNTLTQTIQIDAGLLAQLQQGTINLSIAPNILQTADPNLVQNVQILQQQPQPSTSQEVPANPNVIVQPYTQQTVAQDTATTSGTSRGELVQHVTTLPAGNVLDLNQLVGTVASSGTEQQVQHIQVEVSDLGQAVIQQHHQQQGEDVTDGGGVESDDDDDDPDGTVNEADGEDNLEQHAIINANQEDGSTHQIQVTLANSANADRIHICSVCNKGFRRAGHLRDHMNTHNPPNSSSKNKNTPHVCPTCNKGFTKPSQLQRHVRIHTGERPFVCDICQRAFNQKNALQIHMKKHNGERPHKCAYCDLAFTQKGNLKTHIKRAHHIDMVQAMNISGRGGPHELTSAAAAAMASTSQASAGGGEVGVDEQDHVQVNKTVEVGAVEGMDLDGVVNQLLAQSQ